MFSEKLSYLLVVLMVFLVSSCVSWGKQDAPTTIDWVQLDQAQNRSINDGKKILVHVYTDWCEFCKKLEDTVYPDSAVVASVSEMYHAVKLDADSNEMIRFNNEDITMRQLARSLGVRSYPTILFIDNKGDLLLQINGYMPVDDFKNMLAYIGEEAFTKTEFHEFAAQRSRR
jgi:thioredoxin-related protein